MEDGSAEDEVVGAVVVGAGQVGAELLERRLDEELVRSRPLPGLDEHRRLGVDANDVAVGRHLGDGGGQVAAAAAEIEDPVGPAQRRLGEEGGVVCPVVAGVGSVGSAVPAGHPGPLVHIVRFFV